MSRTIFPQFEDLKTIGPVWTGFVVALSGMGFDSLGNFVESDVTYEKIEPYRTRVARKSEEYLPNLMQQTRCLYRRWFVARREDYLDLHLSYNWENLENFCYVETLAPDSNLECLDLHGGEWEVLGKTR